ncbi:UPF0045 protein ECM15-like protein [Terfezia claveryi]|nr:UPF0045 protein ECM15-like protein [Terfezia claveryi]
MPPLPPLPSLETLTTPPKCSADVCLIPIGTGTPSIANEIAAIQRLLAASKLVYTMHSAGTTIEGTWDEVMKAIGQCHTLLHGTGIVRIQSDIRVGTRTDKIQTHKDKITSVQRILRDTEEQQEEAAGTDIPSILS